MMRKVKIIIILTFICGFFAVAEPPMNMNSEWQQIMIDVVKSFPDKGGYYTGRKATPDFPKNTWQGLSDCFIMTHNDSCPEIDVEQARPSFCSSATYVAILKTLSKWDATHHKISREAWINMKPYTRVVDALNPEAISQSDGEGCWGRANANGPGVAVLVTDLEAGYNFTAYRGANDPRHKETPDEVYLTDDQWRNHQVWNKAEPGDLMKIFWDRNASRGRDSGAIIGDDGNSESEQESGHSVVFMGYTADGKVIYWSSNGPGKEPAKNGYGFAECDKTSIQRVVFTRITHPENFNNAKNIAPKDTHRWLYDLNGNIHGTTQELKQHCGITE